MERSERSASAMAKVEKSRSPYEFYGKPFYGKTTTDVIVQEGNHAFFHCLVHNLGNQTVSTNRTTHLVRFLQPISTFLFIFFPKKIYFCPQVRSVGLVRLSEGQKDRRQEKS